MLKKLLLIVLISLFTGSMGQALAQTDAADALIIASYDGDIWSWSEATGLTRLTEEAHNWGVNRSPDGRTLAYAATADFVLAAYERNDYYPVEITPTNIWLYDLQTNEAVQIATQPPEAVYSQEDVIGYNRFTPQWSPDGTQLAWIQLAVGVANPGWQMVIYDIRTATEQIVVEKLPGPFGDAGFVGTIELRWATIGLITDTFGGTSDNFFGQTLRIYDEDGTRLAEHHVLDFENMQTWFWSDADATKGIVGLATNYRTGVRGYWLVDPFGGTEQELPELTALVTTRSAPDQLALYVEENDDTQTAYWWNLSSDEARSDELTVDRWPPLQMAMAPDGERLAYITDALYIWDNGELQRIADTEQFAPTNRVVMLHWGEPLWQVYPRSAIPN